MAFKIMAFTLQLWCFLEFMFSKYFITHILGVFSVILMYKLSIHFLIIWVAEMTFLRSPRVGTPATPFP